MAQRGARQGPRVQQDALPRIQLAQVRARASAGANRGVGPGPLRFVAAARDGACALASTRRPIVSAFYAGPQDVVNTMFSLSHGLPYAGLAAAYLRRDAAHAADAVDAGLLKVRAAGQHARAWHPTCTRTVPPRLQGDAKRAYLEYLEGRGLHGLGSFLREFISSLSKPGAA